MQLPQTFEASSVSQQANNQFLQQTTLKGKVNMKLKLCLITLLYLDSSFFTFTDMG